jgi:NAD(P)-dependent dehydrogenase (short-subunit alcohol dehydrogenase family)
MRKVVVITGASAGIGRATAVEFARRRARVALLARGEEGLRGALRDVNQAGGEGLVFRTHVTDPAQVEAAADEIERVWGPIGVWVNNAMVMVVSPVLDIAPEDYRRVTEATSPSWPDTGVSGGPFCAVSPAA